MVVVVEDGGTPETAGDEEEVVFSTWLLKETSLAFLGDIMTASLPSVASTDDG